MPSRAAPQSSPPSSPAGQTPQNATGYTAADAAADKGVSPTVYMPPEGPLPETEALTRRSLIGQALYDTFGQTGARIGAIWIAIIAIMAVCAPFLANSHPVLMHTVGGGGGGWSSPMLGALTPLDVCLVIYLAYACWVLGSRLGAPLTLAFLLWPVMAAATAVLVAHHGWDLVTLDLYRPDWLAKSTGFGRVTGWIWVGFVHLLAAALAVIGLVVVVRSTRAFHRAARPRRALAIGAAGAALLMVVSWFTIHPPQSVVYESYREMQRAGKVDHVVRTVVPYSPNDRQRDRSGDQALRPPDREHWLGTTQFREDVLSRMVHACRVALAIGVIATSIAAVIGIVLGGLMGYYAGTVDLLGMRVLDIVEAIPTLILLLIVTVFFGRSLYLMMVVIGLVSWPADARFIRAEFLRLRQLDFVQAAKAAGLRRSSIIFRHMLPNGIAPVLVNASFGVAGAILLESTLSFLGLGLGPDDPSWGQLLNQARTGGTGFNWWIATFPGAAIFLTVFAYILIGEAMRDALDPRLRKRD
jgi:peptide/nickel transport system permease protein